jgi:hypothetical protein
MIYPHLFDAQKKLVSDVRKSWTNGMPFLLLAGQRSGKSTVTTALVEEGIPSLVIDSTDSRCKHLYQDCVDASIPNAGPVYRFSLHPGTKKIQAHLDRLIETVLPQLLKKHPDLVVVLHEFGWWPRLPYDGDGGDQEIQGFFQLANEIAGLTHKVLAVGSPSDTWFRNFRLRKLLKEYAFGWTWRIYATWELNEKCSYAQLRHAFSCDDYRFARDFSLGKAIPREQTCEED